MTDDRDDAPTRRWKRPARLPRVSVAVVGGLVALALCGGLAVLFMGGRDVGDGTADGRPVMTRRRRGR